MKVPKAKESTKDMEIERQHPTKTDEHDGLANRDFSKKRNVI